MDLMHISGRLFAVALVTLLPTAATAQVLGTFTWQQRPYCNRQTLTATASGGVFTLAGFDDGCGVAVRAPVTGVTVTPNGTVSLGLSIMASGGGAEQLGATIDLATLSGPSGRSADADEPVDPRPD
jgi:hypothetical protein